ncbi:hypothetical protein D9M70_525660 [compost metagenome]
MGNCGQAVGGIFITAFHADGDCIGTERHQRARRQAGHIGAVAKAEDIDPARLDQPGDEGLEDRCLVVGACGAEVAAGNLDLLLQAELATGALLQFVAQLVDRGNHLLQGGYQLGLQTGETTQVHDFGQAIDGRR